jgi:hypothetical protein
MFPPSISYADVLSKQLVENWGDNKGFDAEETILMHLEERFEVEQFEIVRAKDEGDQLILEISAEQWEKPKEFGLLSNGSLVW